MLSRLTRFFFGKEQLEIGEQFKNREQWTLKKALAIFLVASFSNALLEILLDAQNLIPAISYDAYMFPRGITYLYFTWYFHPNRQDGGVVGCFQIPSKREIGKIANIGIKWALLQALLYDLIVNIQILVFEMEIPTNNPFLLMDDYLRFPWVALILLNMVVLGPIWEEFFFRQILYQSFGEYLSLPLAVTTSALVFAALHGQIAFIPVLMASGLLKILLYESTNQIWYPIAMHMAANLISILLAILIG